MIDDNDVDICVYNRDAFYYELPLGATLDIAGIQPGRVSFSHFKNMVGTSLYNRFGYSQITRGNKADNLSFLWNGFGKSHIFRGGLFWCQIWMVQGRQFNFVAKPMKLHVLLRWLQSQARNWLESIGQSGERAERWNSVICRKSTEKVSIDFPDAVAPVRELRTESNKVNKKETRNLVI